MEEKSYYQQFRAWVDEMNMRFDSTALDMYKPLNAQTPERYARYRTMLSFVMEIMGERIREDKYMVANNDRFLRIVGETVAAMMFVNEKIEEVAKRAREMGRK